MKTTIENHTQILEKLSKLTFIKKDGNKLISKEGFTLSWDFEFTNFSTTIMPIQLIIRVSHENVIVSTWGCSDNSEALDFSKFIQKAESNAFNLRYELRDEATERGKALFNSL